MCVTWFAFSKPLFPMLFQLLILKSLVTCFLLGMSYDCLFYFNLIAVSKCRGVGIVTLTLSHRKGGVVSQGVWSAWEDS